VDFRFVSAQIIGLMGENGCGKTTFMQMLAQGGLDGTLDADGNPTEAAAGGKGKGGGSAGGKSRLAAARAASGGVLGAAARRKGESGSLTALGISFKRQHVGPRFRKFDGTVMDFLEANIQYGLSDRMFRLMVMKPLSIDAIAKLQVKSLSGGELQRLAICTALGTPASIFLFDEPSAGLDCEQRIAVGKVIKRWVVTHLGKTAFVIEHDFIMAAAMYDRVIVYEGQPGVECTAKAPVSPLAGFNTFLQMLGVTFRRDPVNHRPRINKKNSTRDREQKAAGQYYTFEDADDDPRSL